ncbi:MAG: GxxExxY protein [Planctomycetaceae bacterium]|nr:GxxExxY protein [Planctomycetaceae bacterium]
MIENEISEKVIGCAIEVHRCLGPGLLESVYEEAVCYELSQAHLSFTRQTFVPIQYKNVRLASPLRLDLLVENILIVELKSKEHVTPLDKAQLLSYLRVCKKRLGLVINFHGIRLVDGIHRIVNSLQDK